MAFYRDTNRINEYYDLSTTSETIYWLIERDETGDTVDAWIYCSFSCIEADGVTDNAYNNLTCINDIGEHVIFDSYQYCCKCTKFLHCEYSEYAQSEV